MARVLVAPNAFKGTLTATEASAAMASAVAIVHPDATIVARPVADGGDGSVDALLTSGSRRIDVPVRGTSGAPRMVPIAMADGTAVVEVANTCGLLLTSPAARAPMRANTLALGDAVRGALDAGASSIVLCLGGSASTDGGVGLLQALGARMLDVDGRDVEPGGQWLSSIASVDLAGLDPRLHDVQLTVATDVDNPLVGAEGAAQVFAPQKGATAREVASLDDGLRAWARVVADVIGEDVSGQPGAGAAGGTAFGAMSLLGADIVSGADLIARAIGLEEQLAAAELVVTGEGSLDTQSLRGKGAVNVARLAMARGLDCAMVCGRIDLDATSLRSIGVTAWGALTDIASESEAMSSAPALLARRTIEVLADLH